MPENFQENISEKIVAQEEENGFIHLADFIEKEYFTNFLNKLDEVADKQVISEIKDTLGLDIQEMQNFIDQKIPVLLEKIKEATQSKKVPIIVGNSFRDILGNSVTVVFNKIIWLVKNFHSSEEKDQEKINNPESVTRKIIDSFSPEAAAYYINELCEDDEKLYLELSTQGGYLKRFDYYLKNYPSGSKRAIYFQFFSEMEKNIDDIGRLTAGLEKVAIFENKSGIEMIDRERLVGDFAKKNLNF